MIEARRTSGVLIFGHRGARAYAPENTLPAFELALAQGADGIELDVHLSADKYPVVIHDETVDKTTNGSGYVHTKTLAELKKLDAGEWFSPDFAGIQIPTLDEVFAAVGDKLFINVEIKAFGGGVEWVVADCIARFGLQDRVIISSFNPLTVRRFYQAMPHVPVGFLYQEKPPWWMRAILLGIPLEAHHPYHEIIDGKYMLETKGEGYRVNTWTVNDPERAVLLRNYGVDTLITDNPDTIVKALGR
jgi:glycerophosphoryl diester phosphodiesterase